MRSNESLCGEIESLRNDNRRLHAELYATKAQVTALLTERDRLNNWVDTLIRQLPKGRPE